jgi:hypothetical protein
MLFRAEQTLREPRLAGGIPPEAHAMREPHPAIHQVGSREESVPVGAPT